MAWLWCTRTIFVSSSWTLEKCFDIAIQTEDCESEFVWSEMEKKPNKKVFGHIIKKRRSFICVCMCTYIYAACISQWMKNFALLLSSSFTRETMNTSILYNSYKIHCIRARTFTLSSLATSLPHTIPNAIHCKRLAIRLDTFECPNLMRVQKNYLNFMHIQTVTINFVCSYRTDDWNESYESYFVWISTILYFTPNIIWCFMFLFSSSILWCRFFNRNCKLKRGIEYIALD